MELQRPNKYLQKWSEPVAQLLYELPVEQIFQQVVVLPCYGEYQLVKGCLDSLDQSARAQQQSTLIIMVVNRKCGDSPAVFADNQATMALVKKTEAIPSSPLAWATYGDMTCLVIDANQPDTAFDESQGVGLARKLGCDCAFALCLKGASTSPWIHTTDADVRVPEDYLHPRSSSAAAINANFVHVPIDPLALSWQALKAYDQSLRYYVDGLTYAESPYAFHTIGSTIIVHAEAYAKVRGFPKRLAGEDFYILNKLAKVGTIANSTRAPLRILDRPSKRVPFGTGAAVTKICTSMSVNKPYTFYDPRCFEYVKIWWQALRSASSRSTPSEIWSAFSRNSKLPTNVLESIDQQLKLTTGMAVAKKQAKTNEAFLENMRIWFDALKHLRLIHIIRDEYLPSIPYQQATASAPWQTLEPDLH